MEKTLVIKWGTSRGRDTYGYTTCNLYVDGKRVASCNGGGYDMQGTVIGEYIQNAYREELKKLPSNRGSLDKNPGYYGLSFWWKGEHHHTYQEGDNISLDGACGVSSMIRIIEAIGLRLYKIHSSKKEDIWTLTDRPKEA